MKIYALYCLILIFTLESCTSSTNVNTESNAIINSPGISDKNKRTNQLDTINCYTDLLSISPFKNDSSFLEKVRKSKILTKTIEILNNRHVDNQKDTVFNYRIDSSTFSFYKADNDIWLHQMILRDKLFKTKFGIGIGDPLDTITSSLHCQELTPQTKTFLLSEIEQLSSIRFNLKNGKIYEIIYCGYMD